ncbi:hypothetical protein [Fervidibacter sacchari]
MRKEVPGWVVGLIIVVVLVVIGLAYWRFSGPKRAPYINPQEAIHQAPKLPPGVLGPGAYPGKEGAGAPPGMHGAGIHGGAAIHGVPPTKQMPR